MEKIPRPEHPNPQFERSTWKNLNGTWQFEIDNGLSGEERGLYKNNIDLADTIIVPFCPESSLSGINVKDFMSGVWYKREFDVSQEEIKERVILHFGAVDYSCSVFVNEKSIGKHSGGYVSFKFDISSYLKVGKNIVTVFVQDNTRDNLIPSGKQCDKYNSAGCLYTRTTGIWQTVWLEYVPHEHIESVKFYSDSKKANEIMKFQLVGTAELFVEVFYEGKTVGKETVFSNGGEEIITIKLSEKHLWEVGHGRLYHVHLTYGKDSINSYFGMRNIRLDKFRFLINEKSIFQRLVLDQGYYPDGIYTAPSDDAIKKDIQLALDMGFNGARLHEKVFEPRYLYHCDEMGYIVWGEYPDWGIDVANPLSIYNIMSEWTDEIERDFNHPSIIGWCPRNEVIVYSSAVKELYKLTKKLDTTRPCIDASGGVHTKTDIFDVHDYEQNPEVFKHKYDCLITENNISDYYLSDLQKYGGQPMFVSEYGGIQWSLDDTGWGYGIGPKTKEEFIDRFKGLTETLMKNKKMLGLCYTQLTDVEQEQNGLYTYNREAKFNPNDISEILKQTAAIEKD